MRVGVISIFALLAGVILVGISHAPTQAGIMEDYKTVLWRAHLESDILQADVEARTNGSRSLLKVSNFSTTSRSQYLYFHVTSAKQNIRSGERLHDQSLSELNASYYQQFRDYPTDFVIICKRGVDLADPRWKTVFLFNNVDGILIGSGDLKAPRRSNQPEE